jgi:hypothetical protein
MPKDSGWLSGTSNKMYWFRHLRLPVTIGAQRCNWQKIIGIRIGSWFIGAIKGDEVAGSALVYDRPRKITAEEI